MLTGNLEPVNENLIAIETKLGWTVMGHTKSQPHHTLVNLFHGGNLADLWRLEVLGIRDPAESKNQRVQEMEA